uniref:Putative ATP-dependent RNA helicase TDRD12 n=1 Tax=Melopsittacus undulatus TaxID=13146 RepID=A0A8C6JXJ8_MELUD
MANAFLIFLCLHLQLLLYLFRWIEDPGCFWVTMKECGPFTVDEMAYKKLNDEINQFYDKSYKDTHEVEPVTVEEGQVCVVFSQELKCWCRAVIKSVMYCTDNYQMECFLVDYAKYIFVTSKDIRVDVEPFMQLPYRAKKCRLYRTRPVSLRMDLCEETAKIVPAKRWDSAATWYFQNLLKASTHMKVKLCAIEDNTFDVFLYVTIKDEKICVNDDLVSKNFARFEEAEENTGSSADYQENQTSLNAERLPGKVVSPTLAFRPVLFQKKIPANLGTGGNHSCEETIKQAMHYVSLIPYIEHGPTVLELTRKKFLGPNFTESYCWPSVARGYDVVAISYQGNDPFIYIPPLLTLLQLEGCYKTFTNRSGPLALILCPGWKKAQLVFELLKTYERCSRQFHPMLIILGQNKAAASSVKIQGCEVIVTTPYSFLRLFEHHNLFCRLCHLVLDEMEVLFSDAAEQVFTILDCYKKATVSEEWEYSLHQIIAVGTHWNKHIARLMKEFMNDPYVVITAMEEASIYGNVQQVKIWALRSNSIFSLKIHKESNSKYILEQWTKKYNSGSPVLLVSTDDCMQSLGITDATCVIHFSLPSPRIFGQRLHSMSDNFSNVSRSLTDQEHTKARSVILFTENSDCHALGILRFLQHAEAEIPPELQDFTAKMLEAEENKKFSRPLCAYLKTFGICKNREACPDRHQINIPSFISDVLCFQILPLHIVSATNYFGRIVDKEKDQYTILAEEINEYFENPSNRISVKKVKALALYGLCEKRLFHRVQVLEIYPKEEENLFFSVKIKYIDEGRTNQVQSCQLLHLPAKFQCLPPQAVEFVVCRVKPIDKETEWNPQVTHYIHHKIKGKPHEAKIVHTLGNTAWVDPMVRVTKLSELKITANEYNVRSEILSTGMGTDNPEHIMQLQKLCGHLKLLLHTENLKSFLCKTASLKLGVFFIFWKKKIHLSFLYFSFHPQIKWFQNEETVTVKVEIASVADHKCEFSKEKVIFSACSRDKFYLADMELHQRILAEKSTCVIKDKEVVIILVKEQKGSWCKLLKKKNNHVSLDFEDWEDCEDDSHFPGTKKMYCTDAVSEDLVDLSEVSGTESDD